MEFYREYLPTFPITPQRRYDIPKPDTARLRRYKHARDTNDTTGGGMNRHGFCSGDYVWAGSGWRTASPAAATPSQAVLDLLKDAGIPYIVLEIGEEYSPK